MKEGGSTGAAYLHTAFPLSSSWGYSRDFSCNLWRYRWIPQCWKVFAGGNGTSTWPAILRRVSWVQNPLRFASSSEKLLPLWVFVERNRHTQIYMKKNLYYPLPQPKELIRWNTVIQNLIPSAPQFPHFFVSKNIMCLKQLPGGTEPLTNPHCLTGCFPSL